MATYILALISLSLLYGHVWGITVHFNSIGKTILGAGVYRVVVDVDRLLNSSVSGASDHGSDLLCVTLGNSGYYNLNLRSLSYDVPAGRTLYQLDTETEDKYSSAVSDETCTPQESCNRGQGTVERVMKTQSTKDNGYIGPMASWDGTMYFVYTPDTDNEVYFGYKPLLQLRKVNERFTFPLDNYPSPLDVDSFSTVLANISTGESRRWVRATGLKLLVVPNERGELVFLTLTRAALYVDPPKKTSDVLEFGHALFAVYPGNHGYAAKLLHLTRDLPQKWYSWGLKDDSGVSYMDGTLCWSPMNSLFCAKWTPEQPQTLPTDIESVLPPGSGVCKGFDDSSMVNLTTDVAIVETPKQGKRLALLFTCFAGKPGQGGMGLLVKDGDEKKTVVRPVTYEGELLTAGAMFITPDNLCDHYIPKEVEDKNPGPTNVNRAHALTGGFMMCLTMLLQVVIASLLY